MLLMLSSCVWGCSDSNSGDVIASSVCYKEMNSVYIQVCLVTAFVVTSNGVYLVIACLSWKQQFTVNYVRQYVNVPRGASKTKCRVATVGVGRLWNDVQSTGFYSSQGLLQHSSRIGTESIPLGLGSHAYYILDFTSSACY